MAADRSSGSPRAEGSKKATFQGRVLSQGQAQGEVMVSHQALSFYGGVDLDSGCVSETGHPLEGKNLKGKIVVFPTGKGSTVGSYALYRLAKTGLAPAALVLERAEPIVVTGAILAEIPCVDGVSVEAVEKAMGGLEAAWDSSRPQAQTRPLAFCARLHGGDLSIYPCVQGLGDETDEVKKDD